MEGWREGMERKVDGKGEGKREREEGRKWREEREGGKDVALTLSLGSASNTLPTELTSWTFWLFL